MGWFILWVGLSIIVSVLAGGKGRSEWGYFLLSLILSPFIGLVVLLVHGDNKPAIEQAQITSGENKKCPYCAETIKTQAILCRYCGKELTQ